MVKYPNISVEEEATSGDYNHLLRVTMKYVEVN